MGEYFWFDGIGNQTVKIIFTKNWENQLHRLQVAHHLKEWRISFKFWLHYKSDRTIAYP